MQRRGSGAAGAAGAERERNIQEKMDFEIRIREGIRKLLTVSTQKDQLLQAVKNLMVCNARIHAYRTELQNQMEEPVSCRTGGWLSDAGTKDRMACRAKVALSDIRIPLMWKGSDHFNNKENSQRYAVFCLFRMGAEVFDTDVAIVDKAITDICFENVTIFDEAGPDFQVKVEVYSCCMEESLYIANTPKKLVKKLKTSLSKATGKKLKATLEDDGTDSILLSDPDIHGAKYSLLAYTTLGLESAEDSFRTHNLTIAGNGQWKHCCEELMKIEIMSPRKPPLFLTKEATSVYHDMSIDSPVKHEGLADIIQRKIEKSDGEFLLCHQKEPASSLWASLFDGSHEMVVQKNMHTASPNDGRGKKRRAPPPPSDKPAYNAKACGNIAELDKENWERPGGTSCSSVDSALSTETQQLQTPIAAPHNVCPCRKNSLADHRNPISLVTKTESETKPVPTPRQKRITEVLDPRSWLQPQT